MKTLDKLREEFELLKEKGKEDCVFNRENLMQFNNTNLLVTWLQYRSEWKKIYNLFDFKQREIKRKRFEFYKKEFSLKISNKDEMEMFIFSDPEYNEFHQKFLIAEEAVDYTEKIREDLKGRAYEIKNYLQYLEYMSGKI